MVEDFPYKGDPVFGKDFVKDIRGISSFAFDFEIVTEESVMDEISSDTNDGFLIEEFVHHGKLCV